MKELGVKQETTFDEVKGTFDCYEGFKITHYGVGAELSERFDSLYYSWEKSFLPIGEVENYQIGIGLNNGTYQQWKDSGYLLTPKLIVQNYEELRNHTFRNWLERLDTHGLDWLRERIVEGECPPLLVSDSRVLSSGDFIDGQHRAYLYSKLFREGEIENPLVPVIIGHMNKRISYIYNSYIFLKMNIPPQEKVKLFRERFMYNK